MEKAEGPKGIGTQQKGEGLGQEIAAIWEPTEEDKEQREGKQSQGLDSKEPD